MWTPNNHDIKIRRTFESLRPSVFSRAHVIAPRWGGIAGPRRLVLPRSSCSPRNSSSGCRRSRYRDYRCDAEPARKGHMCTIVALVLLSQSSVGGGHDASPDESAPRRGRRVLVVAVTVLGGSLRVRIESYGAHVCERPARQHPRDRSPHTGHVGPSPRWPLPRHRQATDLTLKPLYCETDARLLPWFPPHRGPRIVGRNQPTIIATIHTTTATARALNPLIS